MGSVASEKPHAVCIPFPAQGHITPMLQLAKLLNSHGFHITFVNTEYNHNRLVKSRGPLALEGASGFRFEAIPDGLPPSELDGLQDLPQLCNSIDNNFATALCDLLDKLDGPPVSCILSDGIMSFTLEVGKERQIPVVFFWSASTCGYMAYLHYQQLVERGVVPLKDVSALTDGYLNTLIDWVPGMPSMRLRDFPSFIQTTDPDEPLFNYINREAQRAQMSYAIIINTFDALERPVLNAMSPLLPPIYTVGPLPLLCHQIPAGQLESLGSNLLKEESNCIQWLDTKEPNSVVYVNFGSTTVMSNSQLVELAWGLANSEHPFLWVIRRDLVSGDGVVLPPEFMAEIEGRGLLAGWVPQETVLCHVAVGGFLTHCGWNSTLESICGGVPMLCWPFFAEQQTNCRYACTEWGMGMEINGDVKRMDVERLIRQLMGGEERRRRAGEWKGSALAAVEPGGSSFVNWERVVELMASFGSA